MSHPQPDSPHSKPDHRLNRDDLERAERGGIKATPHLVCSEEDCFVPNSELDDGSRGNHGNKASPEAEGRKPKDPSGEDET